MKNLRVGVIGVGGIARTHMPGWKQSPHTEVVASSDINAEALEKWGKNHGISKLYQDYSYGGFTSIVSTLFFSISFNSTETSIEYCLRILGRIRSILSCYSEQCIL